ncbi:NAD(P)-dependent oxidoreductase [Streptomyces sp. NPDC059863]|uniref:NAD(P)-dependent oxidoreductase n=1 Tax=unclassified Streptomyces TaxID=2593676 RepID=UPI003649C5AE
MRIAVLGTGVMGAPIARNLLGAGFQVRVWNRTRHRAEPLAAEGAYVADSPADAATSVNVLVTMLADGPAVEAAMTAEHGAASAASGTSAPSALSTLSPDAVWIQMSTVGVQWAGRLAALADHRLGYVDAPVSGSSVPAEHGELLILASGAPALRDRVQPVFDAVGHRTVWLDRPGDGSRLKVVLNNWLALLVEGMAETQDLATALGLDAREVTDIIDESPLRCAYAVAKGRAMAAGDFTPGFPLRLARKDAALALEAADGHGTSLPLTEALLRRWSTAIELGHGNDDVAAAITAVRRAASAP